jgi:hypothetical protein
MLDISQEGMEDVDATMKKLKALGAQISGIEFIGEDRGGTNNAEIIEFHAEGIERIHERPGKVVRNITPNAEDIQQGAEKFMDHAQTWLNEVESGEVPPETIRRKATTIVSKALKKAADILRLAMKKRVSKQEDNTGSKLDRVTEKYGDYRANQYGVPKSSVFKASGSLLNNLSQARYKFHKKK